MEGYPVEVAVATVNRLPNGSVSATLTPSTILLAVGLEAAIFNK